MGESHESNRIGGAAMTRSKIILWTTVVVIAGIGSVVWKYHRAVPVRSGSIFDGMKPAMPNPATLAESQECATATERMYQREYRQYKPYDTTLVEYTNHASVALGRCYALVTVKGFNQNGYTSTSEKLIDVTENQTVGIFERNGYGNAKILTCGIDRPNSANRFGDASRLSCWDRSIYDATREWHIVAQEYLSDAGTRKDEQ